jgi:predicted dehydrogenase
MRIAIVGCGYVADFYLASLAFHPELSLAGITDRVPERAKSFSTIHRTRDYGSLAALLDDREVELVLNLTNPRSHYEVSRACLEAGRHVYSEKPIATDWNLAVELVELAEGRGLQIVSAPCTVLGEAAQTLWKAVRQGRIGPVRLVYAELDDGMVHREDFGSWFSASGIPWPAKDEFEVGCTLEHAGYYVTWLAAMFGPAESVTAFASCQLPDKGIKEPLEPADTPDFSSGCIRFASGVVARLTCSIIAAHDHTLRLFGDQGTLTVPKAWDFGSPVYLRRWTRWSFRAERHPFLARLVGLGPRRLPLVRQPTFRYKIPGANRIDFCRGVADLAESIRERRPCRLSPRFSLHVNEIVLALQYPQAMGSPRRLVSRFDPVPPMPWAAD